VRYNQEADLEYALKTSDYIRSRCRADRLYAEALYRALCDVKWISKHPFHILKDESWKCTWREAAAIVGDLASTTDVLSDHLDWYSVGKEGYIERYIKEDLDYLGFIPMGAK